MALTDSTLFVGFDRILGKINIQDTTDYAAQGIDFNVDIVKCYVKIEYDLGSGWVVIYNNIGGATEDILPPNSLDFSSVDIPLGSDGKPLAAKYRITYLSVVTTPSTEYDNTDEFEYQYSFTDPEICISATVDCASSKITSVDETEYKTANDLTVVSITRDHTLYPPPTSGLSDLTANVITLTYSPIAQTTWTAEVVSRVVYQQADGLNIVVELEGSKEIVVACDTKLSKVLCCLTQIDKTYQNYLTKNITKAENYAETVVKPTWHYITLFLAATQAGNSNKAAAAYQNILDYSGCGDCDCNDVVSIVTPTNTAGVGNTYNVTSPTGSITVNAVSNGNVITFEIEVSAAILNIINNIGSLFDVAGDGAYITVTPSGSSPKTFTVAYTGPIIHRNQLAQKQIRIDALNPGSLDPNYMVMTVEEIYNGGASVAPAPHTYTFGQSSPNGAGDLALIRVTNFLAPASGTKKFIVNAQLNRRWNVPVMAYAAAATIKCEVFHTDLNSAAGLVILRLIDGEENPLTLAKLNSMLLGGSLYIALDIIIEP